MPSVARHITTQTAAQPDYTLYKHLTQAINYLFTHTPIALRQSIKRYACTIFTAHLSNKYSLAGSLGLTIQRMRTACVHREIDVE